MNLEVIRTSDGSDTLFHRELNQHYHSTFGAVQESRHIFMEAGFLHVLGKLQPGAGNAGSTVNILEVGFGTGLNALMTLFEAEKQGASVHYTAIEAFPLTETSWRGLNYPHHFGPLDYSQVYEQLHLASWNETVEISSRFRLHKVECTLQSYQAPGKIFDLVYFDAFGPDAQPELWTEQIFHDLFNMMKPGGILVTYSVKGIVVRALKAAGFTIEKLPGPPGKRHILRGLLTPQQQGFLCVPS